jgi:hypothetical protein
MDPTPSPGTLRMQKKDFFIFFSYNLPSGTLSSVLIILFLAKILCKNFILQTLFQSAQHLYEKREGSGSGSIPLTNRSRSGRPKKHADPDPDPQHCMKGRFLVEINSFGLKEKLVTCNSNPRKSGCRYLPEIHASRFSVSGSLRPKLGELLALYHGITSILYIKVSVPDPGCLSQILIFVHLKSPIQKQQRVTKKLVVLPFCVATNITKLKIILFLNVRRKNLGRFTKNYRTFYQKLSKI